MNVPSVHTPSSSSSSTEQHDFRRDRNINSCMVCADIWPSCAGLISKFNTCSNCQLGVHSSCVDIAKQCYECNQEAIAEKLQNHRECPLHYEGRVSARVLH